MTCEELFERLLALDHSRRPPWGPLHAVAVTCFFLQHPAHPLAPLGRNDPGWAILHAYLAGGQQALDAVTDAARRSNSRGHRGRGGAARPPFDSSPPMPDRPAPRALKVTIADVAADGSFPAPGYEQRVRRWAEDTVAMWTSCAP
ncbi:hypothetical protein HC031_07850 [Planosporangium thailandense]|uniref:Uncharacterized protein n=1 Tax=Planosporangium thailandense TaxID=765197 RepID=A0ABX0XUD3_9ACTN|nr:hypothetical protein [Planosporangium thailandense]